MAVLSDADRALVAADYNRNNVDGVTGTFVGVIRSDLRAAVDAADDWANSNAGSFNNALPTAAKNNLTAPQKARLLMMVIRKRWQVGA